MYCKFCGKQQDDGAFCKYCGGKQHTDEPAEYTDSYPVTEEREEYYDYDYEPAYEEPIYQEPVYQEPEYTESEKNNKPVIIAVVAGMCVLIIGVVLSFALIFSKGDNIETEDPLKTAVVQNASSQPPEEEESEPDENAENDTTSKTEATTSKPETTTDKTETEPEEPEKIVEVIPASDLMKMDAYEILDIIGDDYRVAYDSDGNVRGYTSDDYFPNVYIRPMQMPDYASLPAFEDLTDFIVNGDVGALIGDNAYVGMRYTEMLVLIDSLSGVDWKGRSVSIVDDLFFELVFDYSGNIDTEYVVDGSDADPVCTWFSFHPIFEDVMIPATVDCSDKTALRNAPHDGAAILWYVNDGTQLYLGDTQRVGQNSEWIFVSAYYTDAGVRKVGYIKASDLYY